MERILITGASGFVGRALVERLATDGHDLVLAMRAETLSTPRARTTRIQIGNIGPETDWAHALDGCSVVIHLAAQTPGRHVPASDFISVNEQGTARLTDQAAKSQVRLFVNLSSLHAVSSDSSEPLIGDFTTPHPSSLYGRSKFAAEEHVARLVERGIAAVSLRPPLVIGAEAVGNWGLLQKIAASRLPLPFGNVTAPRSIISVQNLVDAIACVVAQDRGQAPSGRFLLADSEAVSLRDIFRFLRQGMGKPPRLLSVPQPLLALALAPAGKNFAQSLLRGTVVDASRFRQAYTWTPPCSAAEGIMRSGDMFMQAGRAHR